MLIRRVPAAVVAAPIIVLASVWRGLIYYNNNKTVIFSNLRCINTLACKNIRIYLSAN